MSIMNMNRRRFLRASTATALGSAVSAMSIVGEPRMAAARGIRAIAFDALVIFDLAIVAQRAEEAFPGQGATLTNLWRTRQFEYTWLRAAGERYEDFWHVIEDALSYTAASMKLQLSGANRDRLMNAYRELQVWPDVPRTLAELHGRGIRMAFLSNFTADMISINLKAAHLDSFFEEHLTTDRVAAFKPSPRAYQMGIDHFRCEREEIAFAAFAAWDAAGAKWFGYPTVWVNRATAPEEHLSVTADVIASDLDTLPEAISALHSGRKDPHEVR